MIADLYARILNFVTNTKRFAEFINDWTITSVIPVP